MKKVETEFKPSVPIKGSCHEDFQEVAEIFAQNFDKYGEIGSSVCVVTQTFYSRSNRPLVGVVSGDKTEYPKDCSRCEKDGVAVAMPW